MQKLTYSQVATYRLHYLGVQGGRCALCNRVPKTPCLDHCHSNGWVRGVLCSGCNAMLGKLENNRGRYGLSDAGAFGAFLNGVVQYLHYHKYGPTGVLHPTHKTEDEKRLARNAKARKTRAAKKESV
ncbi:endonuclease VII [Pseudomonas phage vB_PpuP-Kurepalu-1]